MSMREQHPGPAPGVADPAATGVGAWRASLRTRHAVADLLRRVQQFWRSSGLDLVQPTPNLLARLVDDCPAPERGAASPSALPGSLLAGVVEEALGQLDLARRLLDRLAAVAAVPPGPRAEALALFRSGRARRDAQRAAVIASLHAEAERRWSLELEPWIRSSATRVSSRLQHRLTQEAMRPAGRRLAADQLEASCLGRLSDERSALFAEGAAAGRAQAVLLLERARQWLREQVDDPNLELARLVAVRVDGSLSEGHWMDSREVRLPDAETLAPAADRRSGPEPRAHGLRRWRVARPIARLALLLHLRARIASVVSATADTLSTRLRQHLHAAVQEMDLASAAALKGVSRRVETLLDQETNLGEWWNAAGRDEWTALVARLRRARACLLASVPLPEDTLPSEDAAAESGDGGAETGSAEDTALCAEDPGCPVCLEAGNAVFGFLCRHYQATATDGRHRQAFLDAGGLCPSHTWQLEEVSAPRGLSLTYPPLLDRMAERYQVLARAGDVPRETESAACEACRVRRLAEQRATDLLCASFEDERAGLSRAARTCQHHLAALLGRLPRDRASELLARVSERLQLLADDMREYALKLDALRGNQLSRQEGEAYSRALAFLAGQKRLL